ncbi:hypothetical protein [Myroides sp. TSA_177.3]|uniref:hypothetical protein n=1 Tax=Myroides sp. TSA_177.3 TaxID=3415650 RepID=UPI00404550A2
MERKLLTLSFIIICVSNMFAQVGINTNSPTSSLDISYSGDNIVPDGIQVPRLTLKDLTNKNVSVYTNDQLSTIIYISDITEGDNLGSRVNITKVGYYYFDGVNWASLDKDTNIFNSNGTILANREIKLDGKALSFVANGTNGNGMNIDGETGNIGIGKTPSATERLVISGGQNPLKLEGVNQGNASSDKILAIDADGIVKEMGTGTELLSKLSVPTPAVFKLADNHIQNFLSSAVAGVGQLIPMKLIKSEIKGLVYNEAEATITIPPGTYQMTITYEATHDATDCTISSYFFDFPGENGLVTGSNRVRIHSTASHVQGYRSSHGGSISYIGTIHSTAKIPIKLGRGQSGNCEGPGMELYKNSTQFLVYRLGD